ncbi:MAG: Flp pilus assembly protein CpaB [Hyphomonadaceae bacterium]
MSTRQILILAVALAAAVAALFLVRGMAVREPAVKSTSVAAAIVGVPVLVAGKAMETGDSTAPGDLVWVNFPQEAVGEAFVQQSSTPNATTEYVGAVARQSIAKGEPITAGKLAKPGEQGFMAAILTPGYRAVAVPITAETAAAGFILPNDRVDVIATRKVGSRGEGGGDQVRSNVILANVRVLAIDQKFRPAEKAGATPEPITGGVATLELSTRDAELLAMADEMGDVSLVLRGLETEPDRMNVASANKPGSMRTGFGESGEVKFHGFGTVKEVPVAQSGGGL